jgi:hypothetical protein
MKRTGRIKPNAKRRKKRFSVTFGSADYVRAIQAMPCAICGVSGYSEAAHVVSRGAGGKASDLVPLCGLIKNVSGDARGFSWTATLRGCHHQFDSYRWTLPPDTEKMLTARASELYAEYHNQPQEPK